MTDFSQKSETKKTASKPQSSTPSSGEFDESSSTSEESTTHAFQLTSNEPIPPQILQRMSMQIQQVHGNAATARWIQRQKATHHGGPITTTAPTMVDAVVSNPNVVQRSPISVVLKQGGKAAVKRAIKEFIENRIKSRLQAYMSKKFAKQFLKDATDILDILDSSWWEIGIELIPFAGDIYGAQSFAKKLDAIWDRLKLLEKKVQHATTAASKALKKISLKTNLTGKGKDKLEQIVNKVNNQADHLTEDDLAGAVQDIFGDPVTIGGKTFDHLNEVNEALRGLGNQIDTLVTGIKKGDFDGEVLNEAQRLLSTLSNQKDQIINVLQRAKQAQ